MNILQQNINIYDRYAESVVYGKRIPLTTIRRFAGTDKDGISGFGIIRGAEELGLLCKGGVSPDKIFLANMVYPLIAHVKQNNFDHYVVVYSCKNGRLHIGDPAYGVTKIKADDFKTLMMWRLSRLTLVRFCGKNWVAKPAK